MKLYNEPPIFLGTDFGSNQGACFRVHCYMWKVIWHYLVYRNFFLLTFESIFYSYHIYSGRYFTSFNTFWLKFCFQSLFIILFIININFLFVLFFISFYDFFNSFMAFFIFMTFLTSFLDFFLSFHDFFLFLFVAFLFISMIFSHLFMTFSFIFMIFPYLFMI